MDAEPGTGIPRFDRHFFDGTERFTRIGEGSVGGKGAGLLRIHEILLSRLDPEAFSDFEVAIPTLTVIATDCFDAFRSATRDTRSRTPMRPTTGSPTLSATPSFLRSCWAIYG